VNLVLGSELPDIPGYFVLYPLIVGGVIDEKT
jgi:hypothetical protein